MNELRQVTVRMISPVYDGLEVTVTGTIHSVANWLHENVRAGEAALSVGVIEDEHGQTQWQHNDPEAVQDIKKALDEGNPVHVYSWDEFRPVS